MEYLIFALQDKLKSEPNFSLNDGNYFTKCYREIIRASDSWVINSAKLLNVNNWNLTELEAQRTLWNDEHEAYIKKPRIDLCLNVTQKGNLTLEWEPTESGPKLQNISDFKVFHHGRTGDWADPWNRIFIIRDFVILKSEALSSKEGEYNYLLVGAIIELIETIKNSLKGSFEVSLVNQLVIEYQGPRNSCDCIPINISIESTEDIDKARLKIKAEKWENEKLIQGLGITAQDFGALFIENQRDISRMVKSLKNIVKIDSILRKDKIMGYLNKLPELFPDEFGNIMKAEDLSAKVIELYPNVNNLTPE